MERGENELHNRKPHQDLATSRYPRVLDEFESVFKKERNEKFETCKLLSRKQRDGETLEVFHSVLSARCDLGALERRILRDVFIVSMSNKEAQTELCRSTKTPKEVTAVSELGGVMIDSIFEEDQKRGDGTRERDTN